MSSQTTEVRCPNCGQKYLNIARHWHSNANCSHPLYSEKQHALIRGILLYRGSIETGNAHPSLRVNSIDKPVLEWLDSQFGVLSRGVHKTHSPEEVRESLQSRGWNVTGEPSAMYEWGLRTHPELEQYHSVWYDTDEDGTRTRRVPSHIKRHPTTILTWYLFAGRIEDTDEDPHVVFPVTSINADLRTLLDLLQPFNPRVYNDSGVEYEEARQDIHLRDSQQFFQYLGNPPTETFQSKWPDEDQVIMSDDSSGAICPSCRQSYQYLSAHWDGSTTCGFPSLSDSQRDVLVALLLSGATLNQTGEEKRPHILLDSTNLVFLDWVRDTLGVLCAHITERAQSEETANRFNNWLDVETKDTNTVYRLQTRSHPFFEKLQETWADRYGKPDEPISPPDDIEPTPMLLQTLYLHRGSYVEYYRDGENIPVIRLNRMTTTNERLLELFERFKPKLTRMTSEFKVLVIEDSRSFFEYIGDPPLGLETLWPENS